VMIVSSVPRMWNADGFDKMDAAKHEFLTTPSVKSVSLSWGAPNFNFSPYSARIVQAGRDLDQGVLTSVEAGDEDYGQVYGLELIAGKFLSEEGEAFQLSRIVINETAQRALSVHVGDKVKVEFWNQEFTIVGIVKDFNFESL